jgi:beta-lactamase class A
LAAIGLLATAVSAQVPPGYDAQFPVQPAHIPTLAQQLGALANVNDGRLGIAATDLETGKTVTFAGSHPFPMASTVKVAIAGAYLAGVDKGRFNLDQLYRYGRRSVLSANQLMERMLIRSDNGAADILLKAVGGPEAVNLWLSHAGVRGQRMDRTIARLVYDDRGRTGRIIPVNLPKTPLEVAQSASFNDDGQIDPAFVGDARDTSTPSAMVQLLTKLHRGALLSAESTEYLFDVMARCVTGSHRLKGLLPVGTPVAHKTGTLAGVSDDVGIVTLPNGHHLAVAVFAKGMRTEWERDRNIAQLTRILYDGFTQFEPSTTTASMGRTIAR